MQTFNFKYLNPENVVMGKQLFASQVASRPGTQMLGEASPQCGYKAKHMHEISNTVKPEIETVQIAYSPSNQKHTYIRVSEEVEILQMEKQKLQRQLEQYRSEFLSLTERKAQLKYQKEISLFQLSQQQANLSLANQTCESQLNDLRSLLLSKQQQFYSH